MIYGLTGGIASGKSTILNYLNRLKYDILDLDLIAHNILLDDEVKNSILSNISQNVLDDNNNIDRKKLSSIVFKDKEKLNILNDIMHKKIIEIMLDKIEEYRLNKKDLIIEVPLLFELNLGKYFDKIILAYVPREVQIERIIKRDNKSRSEAISIIDSQICIEDKIAKSDLVIDTRNSYEDIYLKLDKEFLK